MTDLFQTVFVLRAQGVPLSLAVSTARLPRRKDTGLPDGQGLAEVMRHGPSGSELPLAMDALLKRVEAGEFPTALLKVGDGGRMEPNRVPLTCALVYEDGAYIGTVLFGILGDSACRVWMAMAGMPAPEEGVKLDWDDFQQGFIPRPMPLLKKA
jgi:hypothetical protein